MMMIDDDLVIVSGLLVILFNLGGLDLKIVFIIVLGTLWVNTKSFCWRVSPCLASFSSLHYPVRCNVQLPTAL
jgi:hypothetical protein